VYGYPCSLMEAVRTSSHRETMLGLVVVLTLASPTDPFLVRKPPRSLCRTSSSLARPDSMAQLGRSTNVTMVARALRDGDLALSTAWAVNPP
jgi:hypothetical protein